MRVLVTGASGCLGAHLVESLQRQSGVDVWQTARNLPADDNVIRADLTDRAASSALVAHTRPDLIFHAAGSFADEMETDLATNAWSARWLMDAVREHKLPTRLILVGSAAEYGQVEPEDNPISETRALAPVSVYGFTKATQTLLASHYALEHRVDVVVARLFNLYAPAMSTRLFVGRMQAQIEEYKRGERELIEAGNLDSERDYINIADAVVQLHLIAQRGSTGAVYHVASGRPVRMRDVLTKMLGEVGLDMQMVVEGKCGARRGYDAPVIYADVARTHALRDPSRMSA